MAITKTTKKQYNPSVTAFFDNPKFGEKDEAGNGMEGTAFLSVAIDGDAFTTIQKHIQIGSRLLLRKSRKAGSKAYFLEVLPPQTAPAGRKARATEDEI